jgi:fumarylacetoacetate (FAA) hydrolase
MKLVTFSEKKNSATTRAGLVWGNWILPIGELKTLADQLSIPLVKRLTNLPDQLATVFEVIANGAKILDDLQEISWRIFNRIDPTRVPQVFHKTGDVRLRCPIPSPPLLRDFYAFEEHVKNARARRGLSMPGEWYEFPAFYYSNPSTVVGPDDDIPHPSYSKALDYELEVACVLGGSGVNLDERKAQTLIAGYTIMNDWSARDVQQSEMKIGLGPAKAKDFATSLGPWLVTPDELQDRRVGAGKFDLEMSAKVNGKVLSRGNMRKMYWSFPQMIARASKSVRLRPGEVFGSGTVGTGSILELGPKVHRYLKPGDEVELEIERLGVLRNRIIRSSGAN